MADRTAPRARDRGIAVTLAVLGALGLVAPYLSRAVGLPVPVAANVEVVDHVVPGVVVLAVAAATLVTGRLSLVAALLAALAGFWMTATHIPLLLDAQRGLQSMRAALIHSVPGILLLLVSAAAVVVAWSEDVPPP